VNAVEAAM